MRLLHIHSGNLFGGVETVLRTMAECRETVPSLEPVFALCFEGRIATELRAAGCEVHLLGAVRGSDPFSVFQARARLRSLCAGGDFDAAIVHSTWALALLAPAAPCPLILYQHDVPGSRQWTDLWAGKTRPDLIVANSRFVAASHARSKPRFAVSMLHPPVRLSAHRIAPEKRRMIRAQWSAPESATVVLHAGRFEEWKGHRLLLQSLAQLRDNPDWRLWIAAQPQRPAERLLESELRKLAADLSMADRVSFLGHITDMPAVMDAADIYCQPNTAPEPFGLTFIEALHRGRAVVSTDMGGAREILAPHWGVLAKPDALSISAALRKLLDDPGTRIRLGASGPERARQLCSPQQQIGALGDLVSALGKIRVAA